MDDREIIEKFFMRDESAISDAKAKYGRYCYSVALSVTGSHEDAEECENDTLLRAWRAIPPARPKSLGAYLATICRNIALDRYSERRGERQNLNTERTLDELSECYPDTETDIIDEMYMRELINTCISSLGQEERIIFLQRYWYMQEIKAIAEDCGCSAGKVKTVLRRTRIKMKKFFETKGVII